MIQFLKLTVLAFTLCSCGFFTHDTDHEHGKKPTHKKKDHHAVYSRAEGLPSVLPVGGDLKGMHRMSPLPVGKGIMYKNPSLVTNLKTNTILVSAVLYRPEEDKEQIWVFEYNSKEHKWKKRWNASKGARAWSPKLVFDSKGRGWLGWCGLDEKVKPGNHQQFIWIRQVFPQTGPRYRMTKRRGRNCGIDMAVDSRDKLHLTWESAPQHAPFKSKILYRNMELNTKQMTPEFLISKGPFDRRPTVAAHGEDVVIAWDTWVDRNPTKKKDPDYDIFFRERRGGKFSRIKTLDSSPGIQAAPSAAFSKPGEILIAYHSTSEKNPLVKHWKLRKVTKGEIEEYQSPRPMLKKKQIAEVQGAEFPTLVVGPKNQWAILSRPSHGAFLHLLGERSVASVDLARSGWGARGLFMDGAFGKSNELYVVRRARKESLFEKIVLKSSIPQKRIFVPVTTENKITQALPSRSIKRPSGDGPYQNYKAFFGDVHLHSGLSDGTGPADEIYARSFVRDLDYAVLTDHDNVVGSRLFPSQYMEIMWVTDAFNQIPNFVTIQGYEWTSPIMPKGNGHRNIYFKDYGPNPVFSYRDYHSSTKQLFDALRERKGEVFAVPHHTGWTGTDWENSDPEIQRHVEVTSVHGAYEAINDNPFKTRGEMKGMFIRDGLAQGYKFGMVAGSDGHGLLHHHGIARHEDPWIHGLTAVFAKKLNREQIWSGIYERRTYATSGPRPDMFLEINGRVIGEEMITDTRPILRYNVKSPTPIREFLIVRDGKPLYRRDVNAKNFSGLWADTAVTQGKHNYYLRIIYDSELEGDEMAWTSPIFLDLKAEKKLSKNPQSELSL